MEACLPSGRAKMTDFGVFENKLAEKCTKNSYRFEKRTYYVSEKQKGQTNSFYIDTDSLTINFCVGQ